MTILMEVKELTTHFHTLDGIIRAVNGISYSIEEGEIIGVVGESGCGKSVHALSIMRLVPDPPGRIEKGEIWFDGRDLLKLREREMRKVRGKEIAMIFQEPMSSLNPVLTVGFQIMEALRLHQEMDNAQARDRSEELLALVGVADPRRRLNEYPHQFSGGMRQRAMIAMALSCNPKLLIADEPTTALDVTIQAQILALLRELQQMLEMAVIWITHDLGVVAGLADRVNVMYAGYMVERGEVRDIYKRPQHPYTVGLLGSMPRLDEAPGTRLTSIPGLPPDMVDLPTGCPFAARCDYVDDRCNAELPPMKETDAEGHIVACWEWKRVAEGDRHGRAYRGLLGMEESSGAN